METEDTRQGAAPGICSLVREAREGEAPGLGTLRRLQRERRLGAEGKEVDLPGFLPTGDLNWISPSY